MRRPPLLSLSIKVGLMLFVVVAGALAIVYAAVVPQLESRVVDAKVEELRRSAPAVARRIGDQPNFFAQQSEVVGLGESLNLRVVLLAPLTEEQLVILVDSRGIESGGFSDNPLALRTMETRSPSSGRTSRAAGDFAEVAYPLEDGTVVVLAAQLGDALANVRLVRKSLLVAGAVALVISWFAGYLIAWSFTRKGATSAAGSGNECRHSSRAPAKAGPSLTGVSLWSGTIGM